MGDKIPSGVERYQVRLQRGRELLVQLSPSLTRPTTASKRYNLRPLPHRMAKVLPDDELRDKLADQAKKYGLTGGDIVDYVAKNFKAQRDAERETGAQAQKEKEESQIRQRLAVEEEKAIQAKARRDQELFDLKREIEERREVTDKDQRATMLEKQDRLTSLNIEVLEKQKANAERKSMEIDKEHIKLPFYSDADDIDKYLLHFEKIATVAGWRKSAWACHLIGLLRGRAKDAIAHLSVEKSADYDEVKKALLRYFKVDADTYRQRFKTLRREGEETVVQLLDKLKHCVKLWMEVAGKDSKDADDVLDIFLQERVYESLPKSVCRQVKLMGPKNVEMLAEYATHVEAANRASEQISRDRHFDPNKPKRPFPSRNSEVSDSSSLSSSNYSTSEKGDQGTKAENGHQNYRFCNRCRQSGHSPSNCPRRNQVPPRFQLQQGVNPNATEFRPRGPGQPGSRFQGSVQNPRQNHASFKNFPSCSRAAVHLSRSEVHNTIPSLCKDCAGLEYDPTCVVNVNGVEVVGLRDTGATHCVVAEDYVKETDYTGQLTELTTVSGEVYTVPIAEVDISSPFVYGRVAVVVMKQPDQPVLIGNSVMSHWGEEPIRVPVYANPTYVMQVRTRAQVKKDKMPTEKLPVSQVVMSVTTDKLIQLQKEDPTLDSCADKAGKGMEVRFRRGVIDFIFQNGVLMRRFQDPRCTLRQICVPKSLRPHVLQLAHDQPMAAHLGSDKTLCRIQKDFYWPGISGDVKVYCRSCPVCQKTVDKGRVPNVPLVKTPVVGQAFDKVGVDIVGPIFPASDRGNRYILVMVDYVTRYPEAVPMKNVETVTVAEKLVEMWSRTGLPQTVVTDQGSQFTSDTMREVYRLLGIKGCTTTPYHAQANGLVERFNGTLKKMVKRLAKEKPKDWDKWITAALFAYREVPQASTGFSPFELLYGRHVRGPMKLIKEAWIDPEADETRTLAQYVVDLKTNIRDTCEVAKQALSEAGDVQKRQFDRKTKVRMFEPGDRVLILRPEKTNKLELAWKGPYKVLERLNSVDYKVQVERGTKTYHANLLKAYIERPLALIPSSVNRTQVSKTSRSTQASSDGEEEDQLLSAPQRSMGYHLATLMWSAQPAKKVMTKHQRPVLEVRCHSTCRQFWLTFTDCESTKVLREDSQQSTCREQEYQPYEQLFLAVVWAIVSCQDIIQQREVEVWIEEDTWNKILQLAKEGRWTDRMLNWANFLLPVQWKFHVLPVPRGQSRDQATVRAGDKLPRDMSAVLRAVVIEEDEGQVPVIEKDIPVFPLEATETHEDAVIGTEDPQFKEQIKQLLSEYPDVFSDLPGTTNLEQCKIELSDDNPIRCKPYPVPFTQRDVVKEEVEAMLKMDVIEPSVSPYASPIVLVKKKDGRIRFCVDYRKLNKSVVFDVEPMPDVEYLFAKLGESRVLSKVDLAKGYWQIPIPPEDRPKTAFQTPQGTFQWKVMPFGLCTSGAVFTRMMRKLLLPLGCGAIDNFIDDILVATKSKEEHLQVLRQLFDRLKECKLTARPSKCEFGGTEVEYLGHMIGKGEISPTPSKMEKIQNAARPRTQKEVRSFLGLVGYYRKFIPGFSEIATPLTDLTTKGKPRQVVWDDNCQQAFEQLKGAFCSRPIHRLPRSEGKFVLRTDASDTGLGAILLQYQDGDLFPLACASKKLNPAERKYPIIEKEFLAIRWGVDKFAVYLYGTQFVVQTDHAPLKAWESIKSASGRCTKWALHLQPYKFTVESIPGSENQAADFLSRLHNEQVVMGV